MEKIFQNKIELQQNLADSSQVSDNILDAIIPQLDKCQQDLDKIKSCAVPGLGYSDKLPLFDSILSSVSDGVIISTSSGIVKFNDHTRELLGLPSSCGIAEVTSAIEQSGLKRALGTGDAGLLSGQFIFKTAANKVVEIKWSTFEDNPASKYTVTVLKDTTPQLQVDRIQSDFIASISHELRTPLTTIQNSISNMLAGVTGKLPRKSIEYLGTMEMDCHRLAHLINDLLDMAKLEAGKMPINRKSVSLNELIEKARRVFSNGMREKNITCEVKYNTSISRVYVDAERILQVLCNLLSNAVKYTNANGSISIRVFEQDGEIVTVVQDTGIGIDPDRQNFIFKKFYQVSRQVGPGYNGSGLGLALCNEIMALHGGRIWLESQPGKGSSFYFSIPKTGAQVILDKHLQALSERVKKFNQQFAVFVLRFEIPTEAVSVNRALLDSSLHELTGKFEKLAAMREDLVIRNGDLEITMILNQVGKRYLKYIKKNISAAVHEILANSYCNHTQIVPMLGMSVFPSDSQNLEEFETRVRREVNRLF